MPDVREVWSVWLHLHVHGQQLNLCLSMALYHALQGVKTYASTQVHWAYVDCVRWLGDIVLSKSVHNKVFLWEPDLSSKETRHKGYVKCYQVCPLSVLKGKLSVC